MNRTNGYLNRVIESSRVFDFCLADCTLDRHCHLAAKVAQSNLFSLLIKEMRSLILDNGLKQTTRLTQDDKPTPLRDTDIMNHTAHRQRITGLTIINCHTRCFMLR